MAKVFPIILIFGKIAKPDPVPDKNEPTVPIANRGLVRSC